MRRFALALILVPLVAACGNDDNNVAPTKNSATNNAASNNGTTGSNNGTTASNNGTGGTNNASTNAATNNNTGGPNNATSCVELDPALGDCDPLCQTGCEIGDHCLVDAEGVAACGPAGIRSQGDACNADTECAVGLHCRSVGAEPKACLNYCNPAGEPGCPTNHACVRLASDNRVGACVEIKNDCDIVPMDTCADPDECYDTIQGRQCLPSGMAAADEECGSSSDCAPGLRCVNVANTGLLCKPVCDPNGAADQCADGVCQSLSSPEGRPLSWGACY